MINVVPAHRLGLFGGTFDPPHNGHVAALRAAAGTGRFDAIEVTVAGDPYRKSALGGVHSAATRLAMALAAFDHLDLVRVSEREINRPGPSYTIDTVEELLLEFDHVDLKSKKMEVSKLSCEGRGLTQIQREIALCVVRCAHCHRRRTARQFGWAKGISLLPGCSSAW